MKSVSDAEWFAARQAARDGRWLVVLRFAESRGWVMLASHVRRLATMAGNQDERDFSRYVVAMALLLDRPDEPDPFQRTGDA